MKKILLLILTSLVLFACQKEDTELMGNGLSVTCKNPTIRGVTQPAGGYDWKLITNPSHGNWTVKDESGQNVPHYEYWNYYKMYFICTCEEKSKVFNIDEFKTQISKP